MRPPFLASAFYSQLGVPRYPRAFGFQFHMEVTAPVVEDWLSTLAAPPGGVQALAQIRAGMDDHLAAMQSIALGVFTHWARLL